MNARLWFLLLVALIADAAASPLFDDQAVLDIELSGPVSALVENTDDRDERPFVLTANGVAHDVKVRIRGRSRLSVCKFPPLRLNFNSDDSGETTFDGQDKVKLVTHCYPGERGAASVLKEFAAYRIFNLISDASFRVRLLRITYDDTAGDRDDWPGTHYGFLIESADELAERIGGKAVHVPHITLGSLNAAQAATVYVYQYLIGNTDWSLVAPENDDCCHNGELIEIDSELFYVPYDFDLSGLVNARHARPDPSLRIKRVTQRRYRGYCIGMDSLQNALTSIKARKADILGVLQGLPDLSEKELKSKTRFLDKFFDDAENEEALLQSFDKRCL